MYDEALRSPSEFTISIGDEDSGGNPHEDEKKIDEKDLRCHLAPMTDTVLKPQVA
jgi:hypothetical protein